MSCKIMLRGFFAAATLGSIALAFISPPVCVAMIVPEQPYGVAWSRQIGSTSYDASYSVAARGAGSVYISGYTNGSLYAPNAGGQDAFVAKYDALGGLVWSKQIGTSSNDWSSSVAVDGTGNVYVCGHTFGSLFGPNVGGQDAFLTKYDSLGSLLWSKQIGTSSNDSSQSVAVDRVGNVYISGRSFGSLSGPNAGASDAFLTKYDALGNLLWSKQVGTSRDDAFESVAVDRAGNTYVSGSTYGDLFGPNAGDRDVFLVKYDSLGNLLWSTRSGTAREEQGACVAVDSAGNAYLTGYTSGSLFGPNAGRTDAFLVKYGPSGNLLWHEQIGTVAFDYCYSVAVDEADNPHIAGFTSGRLDDPNAGYDDLFQYDVFLMKYDSSGNRLWVEQIVAPDSDVCLSVALDGPGNACYISGYTDGNLCGPNAGSGDAFLIKFVVPEASTFVFLGTGGISLLACARRWKRHGWSRSGRGAVRT